MENNQEYLFIPYGKTPRLNKLRVVITEKLDGTNALICIGKDGSFQVGSRNRWITPGDDNFGFANWAYQNKDVLLSLGAGYHYGEWWGGSIQRGYGVQEKTFSLFDPRMALRDGGLPDCVKVVPTIYQGDFTDECVAEAMGRLGKQGSLASPGYMNPEGIIIRFIASNVVAKRTFDHEDNHKYLTSVAA